MTPWWGTALITLTAAVVASYMTYRLARDNAAWTNRNSNAIKERSAVYVQLAAHAIRYLHDVPIAPDVLADAEIEAKLKVVATDKVQQHWKSFREAMEPLGGGQSLSRLVEGRLRDATAPAEQVNSQAQATDAQLRVTAQGRYDQMIRAMREELGSDT